MYFTKMQATGNDFIIIEPGDIKPDWSEVATVICNRHFGIGADGLILVLPSNRADFKMREFNPDGSEAEACGNGLRCLVKYVFSRGMVDTMAQEILIETIAGIRKALR